MPSLLRKRKSQQKVSDPSPLRPSLSLPDITSPLLDTSTWGWDEVPPLVTSHTVRTTASPSERNRAPSLVRDPNSPVQFHRPFTPWQVVETGVNTHGVAPYKAGGGGGNFRDTAKWRASAAGSQVSLGKKRGRGRGKVPESLNIVVVGGRNVGKTSLIDLLAQSFQHNHTAGATDTDVNVTEKADSNSCAAPVSPMDTPSSPTSPGSPMAQVLQTITEKLTSDPITTPATGPTLRLSSQVVSATVEQYDPVQLRLIDTPGLNLSSDPVGSKARERGVAGLIRLLEERFEDTLKEESRIVRTRKRQEDGMIHLVLYVIDARTVLHPREESHIDGDVDWSCFGLFDEDKLPAGPLSSTRSGPQAGLDITEIATIRRLTMRANVLPVLSHTDSLTISQLKQVKEVVRRDLAKVFGQDEGAGFGLFGKPEAEGMRVDTPELSSGSDSENERPPTPTSLNQVARETAMPYSIFSPEVRDGLPSLVREYPWGQANVMDPSQSDFAALRNAVIGEFATALRMQTKEKLYETYRTEKLLAKRSHGR